MREGGPLKAFSVFLSALQDWWRDWVNLAMLNLGWMICWLTIILGPPATFVAYRIANDFAHGRTLYPREIPGMIRRYFGRSLLWFLLNVVVFGGVYVNVSFYSGLGGTLGAVLTGASLAIAALWLVIQFYALPYLMEQDEPKLVQALRNALLTVLASPLYSIVMAAIAAVLLGACYRIPFLLLFGVPMLIAVMGSHAVLERLDRFGKRPTTST